MRFVVHKPTLAAEGKWVAGDQGDVVSPVRGCQNGLARDAGFASGWGGAQGRGSDPGLERDWRAGVCRLRQEKGRGFGGGWASQPGGALVAEQSEQ